MCIICISKKGIRQPGVGVMRTMFESSPDGAGFMFVRDGKVVIRKGFMRFDDFLQAVKAEKFTKEDPVVYHFRIATYGNIRPEMTQPFPLAGRLDYMCKLNVTCNVGIAHNGNIEMPVGEDPAYSDTALFVAKYMPVLIRSAKDVERDEVMKLIKKCTNSKMAILSKEGYINTIGNFIEVRGLLFSNERYKKHK